MRLNGKFILLVLASLTCLTIIMGCTKKQDSRSSAIAPAAPVAGHSAVEMQQVQQEDIAAAKRH